MMFILKLFPQVSARDSFKAREFMVKAWEKYFSAGSHLQGSELVKARVKINDDFGIPLMQTARIEVAGSQAIITNTLPGAFWMMYHIFSDPVVLEAIRTELTKGVRQDEDGACVIDLTHVKSSCPLLLSTFKETMRLHSTSTATRIAMEDYQLGNKYLFKKGSTIMMPSNVQHTNREVWGDTVDTFNYERFAPGPGVKRVNPVAFRGKPPTPPPGTTALIHAEISRLWRRDHPMPWTALCIDRSPHVRGPSGSSI